MRTMFTFAENVARRPYTASSVSSPSAGRAIEVVTMPDFTSIVFVVDDDVSVRESLELLISTIGWRPETFASAQEFLDRPRTVAPGCLVLDLQLPGLSGHCDRRHRSRGASGNRDRQHTGSYKNTNAGATLLRCR